MSGFTGFTRAEHETISRFVVWFDLLFGSDDYTIDDEIEGALATDSELNDLLVKMQADASCFRAFRSWVTRELGYHYRDDLLVACGMPDSVRRALGLPEGTILMAVLPRSGFDDIDLTEMDVRARWKRTRLFIIHNYGIRSTPVELDAVAPVAVAV